MSARRTIWTETEYQGSDLMLEVKKILGDGTTCQIVLNCKRGRVMSVVLRERSVSNVSESFSLDTEPVTQATSQS